MGLSSGPSGAVSMEMRPEVRWKEREGKKEAVSPANARNDP